MSHCELHTEFASHCVVCWQERCRELLSSHQLASASIKLLSQVAREAMYLAHANHDDMCAGVCQECGCEGHADLHEALLVAFGAGYAELTDSSWEIKQEAWSAALDREAAKVK